MIAVSNSLTRSESFLERVFRDVRLLHAEFRHRIGVALSLRGIFRRFAARCTRYEAQRLRQLCEGTKKPEGSLVVELSRYLYDQGLNPLLDPKIADLRPDLFEPSARSWTMYVEAKQYTNFRPPNTLKYFRQVWETWGRLDTQYHVPEAFLVVFRRGGPLVDFPQEVCYKRRRLIPILVDIAESKHTGSLAKRTPIEVTEDDLRPRRV